MPQVLPLVFAGIGAAAAVAGVVESKKATKQAAAVAAEQKAQAKNAAALETTATTTDANVQMGTQDPTAQRRTGAVSKASQAMKPKASSVLGGVSASSVGGL